MRIRKIYGLLKTLSSMRLNNDTDDRSDKVKKILGEMPTYLLVWAYIVLGFILISVCLIGCFAPWPGGEGETILKHILRIIS